MSHVVLLARIRVTKACDAHLNVSGQVNGVLSLCAHYKSHAAHTARIITVAFMVRESWSYASMEFSGFPFYVHGRHDVEWSLG